MIATPRGSVPEIVVDGVTGWIAASVEDMAAAVERCDEIDPQRMPCAGRAALLARAHGGGLRRTPSIA